MNYRFDPDHDLTNAEITQVLREIYKIIPLVQYEGLEVDCPTLFSFLVEN